MVDDSANDEERAKGTQNESQLIHGTNLPPSEFQQQRKANCREHQNSTQQIIDNVHSSMALGRVERVHAGHRVRLIQLDPTRLDYPFQRVTLSTWLSRRPGM
ncbi:unnamed protein product [Phytophthora lilii]|uniref:Unnamed protein product n=1 Tax=Phytophthora lilii TaxID=2077276 RepID=A0A9W6X7C7_9STRA|nr:unnamed protein product [Phytophthora lilii]